NAQGQPSTDPADYRDGAMLPFGGHKGYCLAMFCEVRAGALTGAGCSTTGIERVANGFLGLFLDPAAFCGEEF
ncbi:Ldh family oxidoreductase, partial [Methylobacterium crusticola]|uniref:Ldh family oxidoreductase n=1 Tax=Methylobacterium crusticola TaxID=1697972 RepID=UPI001EE2F7F4